jgi:hypothetical protein
LQVARNKKFEKRKKKKYQIVIKMNNIVFGLKEDKPHPNPPQRGGENRSLLFLFITFQT